MQILHGLLNSITMQDLSTPISSCRHCRFYRPQGRRGGQCEQLSVDVQGAWQACALVEPPFKSGPEPQARELAETSVKATSIARLRVPTSISSSWIRQAIFYEWLRYDWVPWQMQALELIPNTSLIWSCGKFKFGCLFWLRVLVSFWDLGDRKTSFRRPQNFRLRPRLLLQSGF